MFYLLKYLVLIRMGIIFLEDYLRNKMFTDSCNTFFKKIILIKIILVILK